MGTPNPLRSDSPSAAENIQILDSRYFHSLDVMREAFEKTAEPCLLVLDHNEFNEALSWLGESDDICHHGDSQEIIQFRTERLKQKLNKSCDPLTGLINRQRFIQTLEQELKTADKENPVGVVMADLDLFKQINDSLGHAAGDRILQTAAAVIQNVCGDKYLAGRIGGEEFGIVVRGETGGRELADVIRSQLERTVMEGSTLTASFGIATTSSPCSSEDLLANGNQALYAAKANGRNCCIEFCDLQEQSRQSGNDIDVMGLENQAHVLAERVANVITMRSRKIVKSARDEADLDGLTGCFNRRCLDRRLCQEFENRNQPLTLAFLDLDYFGQVNKTFGWQTGDKLLIEVCSAIRDSIRSTDWIGRYGGEEFCLVLPETTITEALAVLKRIHRCVADREFISLDGSTVPMTVSIGAAESQSADSSFEDIIGRASENALTAKNNGRNRVVA